MISCYTDGSCYPNPGPAGAGVVLLSGAWRAEGSIFLPHATNNVAELSAILYALRALRSATSRQVEIVSDSQYALGVASGRYVPRANEELVARLHRAAASFRALEWRWVRGHVGEPENERADLLASIARTDGITRWQEGRIPIEKKRKSRK